MRLSSAVVVVAAALAAIACGGSDSPTAPSPSDPSVGLNVPFSTTDLVIGSGDEAAPGRTIVVQYSLWLYDPNAPENKGRHVQSQTFSFVLGGNVIAGWNQGIPGMRVGGTRRLVIPPSLGYGATGNPPAIPGNATLLFEVTLLDVQ